MSAHRELVAVLTACFTPFGGVTIDMFDEGDRPSEEELKKMLVWSHRSPANALEVSAPPPRFAEEG